MTLRETSDRPRGVPPWWGRWTGVKVCTGLIAVEIAADVGDPGPLTTTCTIGVLLFWLLCVRIALRWPQ